MIFARTSPGYGGDGSSNASSHASSAASSVYEVSGYGGGGSGRGGRGAGGRGSSGLYQNYSQSYSYGGYYEDDDVTPVRLYIFICTCTLNFVHSFTNMCMYVHV